MPYLEAAAKAPREPDGFVFSPSIRNHTNLATMLGKRLKRLGITAWEKAFHNLRFSCYTDFVNAGIAPATVSKMLGNTDITGLRHYHDSTSSVLTYAAGLSFVASPPATVDESLAASVELCGDLSAALGIVFDTADESDLSTGANTDAPRARDENHSEKLTRIPTRALPEPGAIGQNGKNAESVKSPDLQHMTPHCATRKATRHARQDSNL